MNTQHEWLETDGLGGFASGTATLARTRRYHALLMHAGPPSRRFVLVNGFDAHVATPDGRFALSAQHYAPGVTVPDGVSRLESFAAEPWPTWVFRLPCGRAVREQIFIAHGQTATSQRGGQREHEHERADRSRGDSRQRAALANGKARRR